MKVRPRLAVYGKLKNLLGLGHIIEPGLKRNMGVRVRVKLRSLQTGREVSTAAPLKCRL
jgi:hypothetical protein